jgi:hypothetical protein
MVGKIDTLTHSALYMKHRRAHQEYVRRTLTRGWDAVSQSADKLVMDMVESRRDVPCQLRTGDASVIRVIHVQEAEGIFGLKKLR